MISPIVIDDPAELAAREYALELAAGHARDADAEKAAVIVAAFARQLSTDLELPPGRIMLEAYRQMTNEKSRDEL